MSGRHDDLRARMNRAVERLEERLEEAGTRSGERIRLGGKIEGVKLAMSYLRDEELSPRGDVPDFDRVLEPVLGMFRARMRADVWREVWREAAGAQRKSVDAEDRAPSPAALAAQRRESEVLGRVMDLAAERERVALDAADQMRAVVDRERGRPPVR